VAVSSLLKDDWRVLTHLFPSIQHIWVGISMGSSIELYCLRDTELGLYEDGYNKTDKVKSPGV